MDDAPRLPRPLAICRFSRGLSQRDLADLVGVTRETIGRLENGGTPHFTTAQAIADALGYPLQVVFANGNDAVVTVTPQMREAPASDRDFAKTVDHGDGYGSSA